LSRLIEPPSVDESPRVNLLTPREIEVLKLVCEGLLNKQIAAHLQTSEKTIKVHRARIMAKLGVQTTAQLVLIAFKAGLISMPE
jgi:DNA-binding NarL/FixJ family response regulator